MVKIRYFNIIGLILSLLLLQGCPGKFACSFYNNSQEDLLILTNNNKYIKWPSGTLLRFEGAPYYLKTVSKEYGERIISLLVVKNAMKLYKYKIWSTVDSLPSGYMGRSIESNGILGWMNIAFN
jgi:hypothetical protein